MKYRVIHYPLKKLWKLKEEPLLIREHHKYYMIVPKIITCSRKKVKRK